MIKKPAETQHATENGLNLIFEEAIIIDIEKHLYKRKCLEESHISLEKNTLNYKTDTQGLNEIYGGTP